MWELKSTSFNVILTTMTDDVKNKIAELEKKLYSKDFKPHPVDDTLTHRSTEAAPMWSKADDEAALLEEEKQTEKKHHFMKKFVQFSVGFFAIALVVTAFIWFRGANVVSGEKIDIDISQPPAVSGGDPFDTKFVITNNNVVSVDNATLLIEYPPGFYGAAGNTELRRKSKDLGAIVSGQSINEIISTVLYGEENTSKEVSVTLEYRMAGSNATLKKSTTYSVRILSSPINMSLKIPKEVSSGQETSILVEINSNSKNTISSLIVEADYPTGFNFRSASPAPANSTNSWRINGLKPLEKRTITIRGVIEGQEKEEKITKISVGTVSPEDERRLGIVYTTATETSIITRPFLAIETLINHDKSVDYVNAINDSVQVDILWKSNNTERVNDAVIEVKLKGDVLDEYSLYASGGGFYRSLDNTIIWNRVGTQELASIEPGAKGSVSFNFSPISPGEGSTRVRKNPQIIFEINVRAMRSPGSSISGDIMTSVTRSIKFKTDIRLTAIGEFFSGPFKNTGELPPKADRETTYTISLSAKNSTSNVSNTIIKTTLPIYVKWLGKVFPDGEDITYNEVSSEVVWNAGRIPSGGARDASFQISFTPSVSQVNKQPNLTGDIILTATDDFTKKEVTDRKGPVTTNLTNDTQVGQNQSTVIK